MGKRFIKFTTTAATVSLVATAMVGFASAEETTYKDVPSNYMFYNEIQALTNAKVVSGIGNGYFNPEGAITRGEIAKMIVNALALEAGTNQSFTDVPENHIFYKEIVTLASLNIAHGYGDKSYKPEQQVTRQEIALLASRTLQISSSNENPFKDVEKYANTIVALMDNGIIKGTSPTTFEPTKKATRGEAAAIIARVMNYEANRPFSLDVMHVNDVHAHVTNYTKLVTAVEDQRIQKRDSLLLNAGDVFTGTLYFNVYKGEADMELLNLMDFDVMVFGNHEFDLGSSAEGHAALKKFVEGSNYPFVGTNTDFSKDTLLNVLQSRTITDKPENGKIYDAIIKNVKGERVGIFGLTTEETNGISSPGSVAFENYIERAQATVKALEAQGVNKIVALTHIGYNDNALVDNDLLLAKAVDGIDLIVGGHSHTQLDQPKAISEDSEGNAKDVTIIVQASQNAELLGTVTLEFDENGVISNYDGALIKVSDYAPNEEAEKLLANYKDGVSEFEKVEIGVKTEVDLVNPRSSETSPVSVRKNETILGNLITNGMLLTAREMAPTKNIIFAVQNGGGIRASIPSGQITVGQVKNVLPFANTLAIVDLTGEEIKAMYEHSVRLLPDENGGFLHVSGAKVTFDSSLPSGERVVSVEYLNEKGEYVEVSFDSTKYTIASNAFTIKGGDSYDVLKKAYEEGRATDFGSVDSDNFEKYLKSLGTITAENAKIEGRLVDLNTTK